MAIGRTGDKGPRPPLLPPGKRADNNARAIIRKSSDGPDGHTRARVREARDRTSFPLPATDALPAARPGPAVREVPPRQGAPGSAGRTMGIAGALVAGATALQQVGLKAEAEEARERLHLPKTGNGPAAASAYVLYATAPKYSGSPWEPVPDDKKELLARVMAEVAWSDPDAFVAGLRWQGHPGDPEARASLRKVIDEVLSGKRKPQELPPWLTVAAAGKPAAFPMSRPATFNEEEDSLALAMEAQGKNPHEIESALGDLRRRRANGEPAGPLTFQGPGGGRVTISWQGLPRSENSHRDFGEWLDLAFKLAKRGRDVRVTSYGPFLGNPPEPFTYSQIPPSAANLADMIRQIQAACNSPASLHVLDATAAGPNALETWKKALERVRSSDEYFWRVIQSIWRPTQKMRLLFLDGEHGTLEEVVRKEPPLIIDKLLTNDP
jgi:hypothetical protein